MIERTLLNECLLELKNRNQSAPRESTTILITKINELLARSTHAYTQEAYSKVGFHLLPTIKGTVNWGKTKQEQHDSFLEALTGAGADEQLASDWMDVRKAKKAVNSFSAFTGFVKSVKKSGKTINEALEICNEMNWKGFRADWAASLEPKNAQQPSAGHYTPRETKQGVYAPPSNRNNQNNSPWS